MKNIISLIPAKGKSLRLKNKNLRNYKGKPLVTFTINASVKSKKVFKTYVSSENVNILNLAKNLKAIPVRRIKKLSSNTTTADEVIYDFIKKLKKEKIKNSILVYLQPTSPKRNHHHIDESLKLFFKNKKKTLVSVTKISDKNIVKSYFLKKDRLQAINEKYVNQNDQEIPDIYKQNGAIYIFTVKSFLKDKSIPKKNLVPYIMDTSQSLDINTLGDLKK